MMEENVSIKEKENEKTKKSSAFFKTLGILFISLILATFTVIVINL